MVRIISKSLRAKRLYSGVGHPGHLWINFRRQIVCCYMSPNTINLKRYNHEVGAVMKASSMNAKTVIKGT